MNDYLDNDKSVSFSIKYNFHGKDFPIVFQCGDERCYSIIELDFSFENARLRVFDFENKVEIFKLKKMNYFVHIPI